MYLQMYVDFKRKSAAPHIQYNGYYQKKKKRERARRKEGRREERKKENNKCVGEDMGKL